MKKTSLLFLAASLFLGFVFTAPVFATSNPKKTAVVGFVNLGNFEDNYYNDLATLAIIDYLKSVDGIEVADYKMIRSANRKTGFTKLRQQDITVALKSAKSAKSRYAVFGEYKTSAFECDYHLYRILLRSEEFEKDRFGNLHRQVRAGCVPDDCQNQGKDRTVVDWKNRQFGEVYGAVYGTGLLYALYQQKTDWDL